MKFKSELHAGRAGEHIASADILSHGHDVSHAAQGMPYDLVAEIDGKLLKVQVKTTRSPVDMAPGRNVNTTLYRYSVAVRGKGRKKKYAPGDVDLFALVALDTKEVGYISATQMPQTMFIRPTRLRGTHSDELVAERNSRVMDALNGGMLVEHAAKAFGLDPSYVGRIKAGRARSHRAGLYFSDLPLELALARHAANDNTRIGSKAGNQIKRASQ